MKICFLTHNLNQNNGCGAFSMRLIKGLQEYFDCEIVALTTVAGNFKYEKPILYPDRIKLFKNYFKIRKIVKGCDIIHALDGYPYGVMAVLASLGLKKKIIITAIGSGAVIPLYQKFNGYLMRYCYRKVEQVTAISNFTKNEILKKVNNLSIKVINHGVDYKKFVLAPDKGRSEYAPYILSVGHLRGRKGYHLTIRAFLKISKIFPNLKYAIVGKKHADDYYNALKSIIKDLDLKNKIFILDNINDDEKLIEIYKNAELFCLLSQNANHDVEGFGLVFLEAAASGLPVVGSKGCGVEDAVLNMENGILVGEKNEEEFADAVIKILQNKDLKKKMSEKSLELAKFCDWPRRISEYVDMYKRLI